MVRTKLKNILTGGNQDMTFRISETLETADVMKAPATFSYSDGESVVFMDSETFEERYIPVADMDNVDMLKDGMVCDITMWGEKVVDISLPASDSYLVTYTEQGLPKAASTNQLKPATLETGAEVKVPLFINTGDVIKVNCQEREYMERVSTGKSI